MAVLTALCYLDLRTFTHLGYVVAVNPDITAMPRINSTPSFPPIHSFIQSYELSHIQFYNVSQRASASLQKRIIPEPGGKVTEKNPDDHICAVLTTSIYSPR